MTRDYAVVRRFVDGPPVLRVLSLGRELSMLIKRVGGSVASNDFFSSAVAP